MPRATKDLGIALNRAASLLPMGEALPGAKKGRRELRYRRPDGSREEIQGTTAHCLYSAVLAVTTPPERGGFGRPLDEVARAVALKPDGLYRAGLKSHEESLVRRLAK